VDAHLESGPGRDLGGAVHALHLEYAAPGEIKRFGHLVLRECSPFAGVRRDAIFSQRFAGTSYDFVAGGVEST
jgi:hypothetical protein